MLTPLEERVLNAQALSAGLAATVMVQDLIRKGEEAHIGVLDHSLPNEVRAEAVRIHVRSMIHLLLLQVFRHCPGLGHRILMNVFDIVACAIIMGVAWGFAYTLTKARRIK